MRQVLTRQEIPDILLEKHETSFRLHFYPVQLIDRIDCGTINAVVDEGQIVQLELVPVAFIENKRPEIYEAQSLRTHSSET